MKNQILQVDGLELACHLPAAKVVCDQHQTGPLDVVLLDPQAHVGLVACDILMFSLIFMIF
jgi:hypothetical protein